MNLREDDGAIPPSQTSPQIKRIYTGVWPKPAGLGGADGAWLPDRRRATQWLARRTHAWQFSTARRAAVGRGYPLTARRARGAPVGAAYTRGVSSP